MHAQRDVMLLWGAAPVPPVQMELSLVLGILLAPTVWLGHFVSMAYPLYAKLAPTQQQELQAVAYALLAPFLPPTRAHAATALLAL